MEKQVVIKEQFALQESKYVKNGETKKFASMGFILFDGMDEFYAELTGNAARECPVFSKASGYVVQCEMRVSTWETSDHRTAYKTQIYINRIKEVKYES